MEGTRTLLRAWFALIFLMANQSTGLSASRLLGISYKRASLMARKIRKAMEARDSRYVLAGLVEMDESYFGSTKSGKGGRGTEGWAAYRGALSDFEHEFRTLGSPEAASS